ncbi:hypothetical protein [Kribbella sp. NPDC006257]|uniref:hypothetical protein n=1 Tax=Kribbella sp. NPDC006257 TaxID=3156738 RepID=UPI0033AC9E45
MSKNLLRRVVLALGTFVAMVALTGLTATTASAVGCTGTGCYNKGPVAMGCTADQRAISSGEYDVVVIYSPACRAAWVQSYATPSFWCISLQIERGFYDHDHNLIVDKRLSTSSAPARQKSGPTCSAAAGTGAVSGPTPRDRIRTARGSTGDPPIRNVSD